MVMPGAFFNTERRHVDRDVDAVAVAFFSALIVGSALHYHKIVQNEWYGYPDEWFPSVSATIGDRYPERSIFMIFIAITSGTPVANPCLSSAAIALLTTNPRQGQDSRSSDYGTCSPRNPAAPSRKRLLSPALSAP
jgi:hypothetical protein